MAAALFILFSWACTPPVEPKTQFISQGRSTKLASLTQCGSGPAPQAVELSHKPVAILVHGLSSHSSRMGSLAYEVERRGHQAACFNYDDRDPLRSSAEELRRTLRAVEKMTAAPIAVMGHSQGGLVARLALTSHRTFPELQNRYQLITIAAPFNGIEAAKHCGLWSVHLSSFGVTLGICSAITGAAWPLLHERASIVVDPPPLVDQVTRHVAIVTEEQKSCHSSPSQRRDLQQCLEEEVVFSTREQINPRLLQDDRTVFERIVGGHVAIVGERGDVPPQLFAGLARHHVFSDTLGTNHQDTSQPVRRPSDSAQLLSCTRCTPPDRQEEIPANLPEENF